MEVKKGIDQAAKIMVEYLQKTKAEVKNRKDLWNLAMISTNKDEEISEIITEALIAVGNKAVIQLEESQTGKNDIKVIKKLNLNIIFYLNIILYFYFLF